MTEWNYLYKKNYTNKVEETTNMLYTPTVNTELNILCMTWDLDYHYQQPHTVAPDVVEYFFNRELTHLEIMQQFDWAPKLLDVDLRNKKIFVEWNKESLNNIICDDTRNLLLECPQWKEQIFNIIKDSMNAGYYKLALYPHCFFLNTDGRVKTIDFYSCVSIEERYIHRSKLNGMIGKQSVDRFNLSTVGDKVDFKMFFEITMTETLGKTWTDNPFPEFYKRLT